MRGRGAKALCRLKPALLAFLLFACHSAPVKQYPFRGVVVSVSPGTKTAAIKNEKIKGWMDAMTMEYPIKDAAGLAKIKPGDKITATVYVRDIDYWLENVQVVE